MALEFIPENPLEKAIHDGNTAQVMQAIAEGYTLNRLIALSQLGSTVFRDEIIYSVLFLATPKNFLAEVEKPAFHQRMKIQSDRLQSLVKEALAPLKNAPSDGERSLIKAIVYQNSRELIHLIRDDGFFFEGFAPELLTMLEGLSPEAVQLFFNKGLSPKLKAIVLGILLKECTEPTLLKDFSYDIRTKYANIFLHIMMRSK